MSDNMQGVSEWYEMPPAIGSRPEDALPPMDGAPEDLEDNSTEVDPLATDRVGKRESDKILKKASEEFSRCVSWEAASRRRFIDDMRFAEGDSDNGYQWPDQIRRDRDTNQKPCLTINKTRQHCLMVINDAKQNKPAIRVRAVGNTATFESAQVCEGIIRYIEYHSNAQTAYDVATETQVKGGIGYWRVCTDYVDERSFDQDIYIRPINNPLSVYLDPDIQQRDGSDARFAFLFDEIPQEQFERENPGIKLEDGVAGSAVLGLSSTEVRHWLKPDHVMVVEYFCVKEIPDTLISYMDKETQQRATMLKSELVVDGENGTLLVDMLLNDPMTITRPTSRREVWWYYIVGNRVHKKLRWPGTYIPIVRLIGEETVLDGELDRKGHVRAMKDPQRIYNYWSSSAVEHVALQTKTPYVGPMAAFENLYGYWANANQQNLSFLPYNHVDDNGNPIPAPARIDPPAMAQAYIQGLQIASEELMSVSGQYQSQLGQQGNEVSGKAINERQRQSDTSTYHYVDNLAIAITFTGKIVLDLIPKIYDTPRVVRILGEDGEDEQVQIDPQAQQALQQNQGEQRDRMDRAKRLDVITKTLNPNLGKYVVHADVGPAYSTKRQEAFNAFTQIISQRPELTMLIGDILLKAGDFPMASEAAERLKRMVPAQALGEAPSQEIQQLQATVQNLQGSLASALQALANKAQETKQAEEKNQIDLYKAQTDRMEALAAALDPQAIAQAVAGLVVGMVRNDQALAAVETQASEPPMPPGMAGNAPGQAGDGAVPESVRPLNNPVPTTEIRRAPRGQHIIPDPNNPGQFIQVQT